MASSYDLARLRRAIRPFRLHWFPRLRSTNDHAAVLRRRGDLFAPAIVLTSHQTAGRGRAGRSWWSAPGVITVTFVMPIQEHIAPHQVPLIAGLAVQQAAGALSANPDIQLKWPNDIVFHKRKLAGLLCERIDRIDLIGVGFNLNMMTEGTGFSVQGSALNVGSWKLNVGRSVRAGSEKTSRAQRPNGNVQQPPLNPEPRTLNPSSEPQTPNPLLPPPDLRPHIISLAQIARRAFDHTDALACLARHIHQALSQRDRAPFSQLSRVYDRHNSLIGRNITILNGPDAPAVSGNCEGIDSTGRLLLRHRGALHRIITGHVIVG